MMTGGIEYSDCLVASALMKDVTWIRQKCVCLSVVHYESVVVLVKSRCIIMPVF